jgi:cytochrome c oxidase assembly protein subunit 11
MVQPSQSTDRTDAGATLARRHRRVGLWAATGAIAMLALAFASVPLYRMFCQATGYGGTPKAAVQASQSILDRTVTVRFDASVSPGLAWTVEPVEATKTVRFGETTTASYRATNTSDHVLVGTSSFNVTPDQTGSYFNKLACFCFTEQRLEPGQTVDMAVQFFVDPEMIKDKDTAHIGLITLSYTFFVVDHPKLSSAGAVLPGKGS